MILQTAFAARGSPVARSKTLSS